jgi:hypothetical protein
MSHCDNRNDHWSYADIAAGWRAQPPHYQDEHVVLGAVDSTVVQMANHSMDMMEMILHAQIETNHQMNEFRQMLNKQPAPCGSHGGCQACGGQFGHDHEGAHAECKCAGNCVSKNNTLESKPYSCEAHTLETGMEGGPRHRERKYAIKQWLGGIHELPYKQPAAGSNHPSSAQQCRPQYDWDGQGIHAEHGQLDGTTDNPGWQSGVITSGPDNNTEPDQADTNTNYAGNGSSLPLTDKRTNTRTGPEPTSHSAKVSVMQGTLLLRVHGQQLDQVLGFGQFQTIHESEAIIGDWSSSLGASPAGGGVHSAPILGPSDNTKHCKSGYAPSDTRSIIAVFQANDGQFLDLQGGEPVLSFEDIKMLLPKGRTDIPTGNSLGGNSGDLVPREPAGGIGGELVSKGLD